MNEGKSFGSIRHWQPVRAIYKIASSTARNSISRGRPKGLAAGICGSISAHSASVTLLAYRCPSRSYFRRVISLHIVCLDDCLTQPSYHNRLKSLISFSVSLLGYWPHASYQNFSCPKRGGATHHVWYSLEGGPYSGTRIRGNCYRFPRFRHGESA